MLEGLDDVIVGLSAGEETSYEGPLAAGDHAGETALIRIKVTAVKERELPAADDAFAQLASEFDTIAELREDLRGQAAKILLNNQAVEARAALVEHLKEAVTFDVPARTIEHEVHSHLEGEGRLEDDEHRAEVTKEAGEALRTQIILDQLVDDLERRPSRSTRFSTTSSTCRASTAWTPRSSSSRCSARTAFPRSSPTSSAPRRRRSRYAGPR